MAGHHIYYYTDIIMRCLLIIIHGDEATRGRILQRDVYNFTCAYNYHTSLLFNVPNPRTTTADDIVLQANHCCLAIS